MAKLTERVDKNVQMVADLQEGQAAIASRMDGVRP